jgi:hypothetical protein
MLSPTLEYESNLITAVIAWREMLAIDHRDIMFPSVVRAVNNAINARPWAFVSWLEYIPSCRISHNALVCESVQHVFEN